MVRDIILLKTKMNILTNNFLNVIIIYNNYQEEVCVVDAQVYEGFFKDGIFFTGGRTLSIPEERKTYITIIAEAVKNPDTWDDLFLLTSEMTDDEKPCIEDFPRFNLGRELLSFDEA